MVNQKLRQFKSTKPGEQRNKSSSYWTIWAPKHSCQFTISKYLIVHVEANPLEKIECAEYLGEKGDYFTRQIGRMLEKGESIDVAIRAQVQEIVNMTKQNKVEKIKFLIYDEDED